MRFLLIGTMTILLFGLTAASAVAAPPENTVAPTISGTAREGSSLTASRGTWTNSPTSYTFAWQRCTSDGVTCVPISGASASTYALQPADVGRTVRVAVTAVNADGRDTVTSEPTAVVGSENGPRSTARPAVTGEALVGEVLEVSNGSWSPTPTIFTYQWQQCDTDGTNCVNIPGATGRTYGVRRADIGTRLRALVTGRTQAGERTTVTSSVSSVAESETPPVATNAAPTVRFVALRRVGVRVYARFVVCDDGVGRVNIVQRDRKARVAGYTRRFAVVVSAGCGSFTRSWVPAARFRTPGRYLVTLTAVDKSRKISRPVTRSLVRR